VLSEKGAPTPVVWTRLYAPSASMSPLDPAAMTQAIAASPQQAKYAEAVDRESAYELLIARTARAEADAAAATAADAAAATAADVAREEAEKAAAAAQKEADRRAKELERIQEKMERDAARERTPTRSRAAGPLDSLLKSAGTALGRDHPDDLRHPEALRPPE